MIIQTYIVPIFFSKKKVQTFHSEDSKKYSALTTSHFGPRWLPADIKMNHILGSEFETLARLDKSLSLPISFGEAFLKCSFTPPPLFACFTKKKKC